VSLLPTTQRLGTVSWLASAGSWRTAPRCMLQASSPRAARSSATSGLRIASVPGSCASQVGRQRKKVAPPLRTIRNGRG